MTVSLRHSARRILPLAWPVVVGQVAVLGFNTVDTLLLAHMGEVQLAALAIGASAYTTIFVGFMGMLYAVSPLAGRHFGAGHLREAGEHLVQGGWLALMLSALGGIALAFPQPLLAIAHAPPEVAADARGYLAALAFSLPATLMFAVFRSFNVAVSRPKAVMAIQVTGFALKLPLSIALASRWGVVGCGIATAIVMWGQVAIAAMLLRRDPFYAKFALHRSGPRREPLMALLKLGLPMGVSLLIEVSGFTFMALFIARLGATPVGGHQIAVNLVSLLFMLPLGLANGTSSLVAQRIGAGDLEDAGRLSGHGVQIAALIAGAVGIAVFAARGAIVRLYTDDPAIVAAALPLLAWVAVFHVADAAQCVSAFVLRAWHVATVPVVIYAVSLWGLGLGGGYVLAFGDGPLAGARGYWSASTTALVLAAASLCALLAWVVKAKRAG